MNPTENHDPVADRLTYWRKLADNATPGPWERGYVWLWAAVMPELLGAGKCAYCHNGNFGDPVWTGEADINGTTGPAHCHRDPEPSDIEHMVSGPGGLVAGPVAYEGGISDPVDTEFVAEARTAVPALLDALEAALNRCDELECHQCDGESFAAGGSTAAAHIRATIRERLLRHRGAAVTEAKPREALVKALSEMSHDLHQACVVLITRGSPAAVVPTLRAVADRAASLAASFDAPGEGDTQPDPPQAATTPHRAAQLQNWIDEEGPRAVAEELAATRDAVDARADALAVARRRYSLLLQALTREVAGRMERDGHDTRDITTEQDQIRAAWDLDEGDWR